MRTMLRHGKTRTACPDGSTISKSYVAYDTILMRLTMPVGGCEEMDKARGDNGVSY